MSENKRIHLLSKPEIEDLYSLPQFNQDERRYYFSLSKSELNDLDLYKNVKTRLYFILQLGYFKATQQFYNFNFEDVKADIRFIFKTYLQTNPLNLKGKISRNYNQKQKENILKLFGYSAWSETHSLQVESHLCELVKTYPKTHNAFRELLVYFEAKKIVIPSYRTLQDIFTKVLRIEQKRISGLILSFPKHLQKQLADLIHHEDGLTQLNIMRADQKDFQYTALKLEIEKTKKLSELYLFCKLCIPKLGLSKNAIRYYADLTDQYAPARLRRLSKAQKFLHLICFVYHRYQQFMDNLIITFMYHVRALLEAGKSYADMAFLQHGSKLVVEFPKLAQFLEWFPSQEVNPGITYSEFSQEAYKILPKQQFEPLAKFIAGHSFDKKAAKWQFYSQSSRMFALYLRPILLTVDFEFHTKDNAIMPLILMLKNHYNSGKFPSALKLSDDLDVTLPKNIIPYLKLNSIDQYVDPHLLEFFVYQKMYHHFDRGRMFCNDSVVLSHLLRKEVFEIRVSSKVGLHNMLNISPELLSHFKGFCSSPSVIMLFVYMKCRFSLSYRDLEEMMMIRGAEIDHSTLQRWVRRFVSLIDKRVRQRKKPVNGSWRMDESYIRLNGKWVYLYRAVDKEGSTIDFLLRAKRDAVAAKAFFRKAFKENGRPDKVTVDKSGSNKAALGYFNKDISQEDQIEIRQIKYLNNIVEQDHRFIKKRTKPTLGFKNFYSARETISGIENIRMIQKGQIVGQHSSQSSFNNFVNLMA